MGVSKMSEDSELYLAPELLPKYRFTKDEIRSIRNMNQFGVKDWFLLGIGSLLFFVILTCQYFLYDGFKMHKIVLDFTSNIKASIVLFFCPLKIIVEAFFLLKPLRCSGAAKGIVQKREVIYQTVNTKFNNELLPYQGTGMPEYRGKSAFYHSDVKRQPFYYLTIQLENSDKQLRYVNCTWETFNQLRIGEEVLAVYYGNDKLIGYQIKK
jgi:hypothetical protein